MTNIVPHRCCHQFVDIALKAIGELFCSAVRPARSTDGRVRALSASWQVVTWIGAEGFAPRMRLVRGSGAGGKAVAVAGTWKIQASARAIFM
jgi:hypothetical protein